MMRYGLIPFLALVLAATTHSDQSPAGEKDKFVIGKPKIAPMRAMKDPTTRELLRWLEEPLDVRPYQVKMALKEVLREFTKSYITRGKDLPHLVDEEAFKEANPDAPDIYDTQVKFPPFPKRMTFEKALRFAISKIPTNNATFLVRRGCIEITTLERGAPARLLEERVVAQFHNRPLADALDDLSDMTGATIILDPHVGEEARTPIRVVLRNSISLEAAVRLLARISGLRAEVDDENILFITNRPKKGSQEKQSDLRLRDRPLKLALKDLARWSGISIILDPRAGQEKYGGGSRVPYPAFPTTGPPMAWPSCAEYPVSATFKGGTSALAAARILAVIVGLEAVSIDNAVFVTTRQVAGQMRGRIAREVAPDVPRRK